MTEERASCLLLNFIRNGVQLAIGNSYNVLTEEDIYEKCFDAQMECIATVPSIPMITMQECWIYCVNDTPFIRLLEDCTQEDQRWYHTKMLYMDAVEKYQKTGFFFYRSDVKSWYHIRDFMVEQMIECDEYYCPVGGGGGGRRSRPERHENHRPARQPVRLQ